MNAGNIGIFLALVISSSSLPAGELVILTASNSFADDVEPGASIQQPGVGSDVTPGEGPIVGVGLVFACGTGDVADFSVYTDQIGGPGSTSISPCASKPRDIVTLDQKLAAKVLSSGNVYDINLSSFRDANACIDGGFVPGCAEANGSTSYLRDPFPSENAYICSGFFLPMAVFPVKAKKNRVFPLKIELIDLDGFELSDLELGAPPVVQVLFSSISGEAPIDVSGDVLSMGAGSEGNQFAFTSDGVWQFNLGSRNYSAKGEYVVTAVSGDDSEYTIAPPCVTSFVIE
jgi:hypothetical protein